MIADIRKILNQGTQNDNDKGCQLDYHTYGKSYCKQEFEEQQAVGDFQKIEWYFENICEIQEPTVDERILNKCEELSVGVFMW